MNSLRLLPRRVFAFVARDFRLFVSYRMQFFLRIISVLAVVTTLFFISKIFAGFTDPQYSQWRDPLATWLTGLAVLNYFMTGFSSLANSIRQEQTQGTLESMLLTPINLPTVIVASSAWDFLETTFFSFLYLFFGRVFFGVQFRGSFFLAVLFLLLTTVVLACLGILSASFAMVFKRGDPFGIFSRCGLGALFRSFLSHSTPERICRSKPRKDLLAPADNTRTPGHQAGADRRPRAIAGDESAHCPALLSRRATSLFSLGLRTRR